MLTKMETSHMKLTKAKLKQIIKEEKAKILTEGEYDNRARAVIRHIRDRYGSAHVAEILQSGLEILNS